MLEVVAINLGRNQYIHMPYQSEDPPYSKRNIKVDTQPWDELNLASLLEGWDGL